VNKSTFSSSLFHFLKTLSLSLFLRWSPFLLFHKKKERKNFSKETRNRTRMSNKEYKREKTGITRVFLLNMRIEKREGERGISQTIESCAYTLGNVMVNLNCSQMCVHPYMNHMEPEEDSLWHKKRKLGL
jgi:hypothetical protein